jgi:hypothetical protein
MTPQNFLDTIRVFGEPDIPDTADPATVFQSYLRALAKYGPDVLQQAADRIAATRKIRKFPLLAECLEACRDAQDAIAAEAQRENGAARRAGKSEDPWSSQRVELADRLMRSEAGQLAADEGWIVFLHDFCRAEGRLPNKFEAGDIRAKGLRLNAESAEREKQFREAGGNPKLLQAVTKAFTTRKTRLSALAREQAPVA